MVHVTITDLAILFTIWSTELTMADPFPLGRECFFWISSVTIVNVHKVLGSRSSNQICFTSLPNHCWFSSTKQIDKIIKGLVIVCFIGVPKELTMWLRKWLNHQLSQDFDTQLSRLVNMWLHLQDVTTPRPCLANRAWVTLNFSRTCGLGRIIWRGEEVWYPWDIIFIRKPCFKRFGKIIDVYYRHLLGDIQDSWFKALNMTPNMKY